MKPTRRLGPSVSFRTCHTTGRFWYSEPATSGRTVVDIRVTSLILGFRRSSSDHAPTVCEHL